VSASRFHPFWTVGCLALLLSLSPCRVSRSGEPSRTGAARQAAPTDAGVDEDDEADLRKAGLSSDGPALLAALNKHVSTPDKLRKIETLIGQLGNDEFRVRETATRQLREFGRLALPRLHDASKDSDPEVARRAKMLIEDIDKGPDTRLPLAVLRLLAVRKPAGAVEALLAYLPFADDDEREEEVRKAVTALARREGKLDAALRRALSNPQARVRTVAAEAVIAGGGADGRAAVRRLLKDDTPSVRLRMALALARGGERDGITVLIDLLPRLSDEEAGQAEGVLYQLAGDAPPTMPDADDKTKRRDAWAGWWKEKGPRLDLGRLRGQPQLGYTLLCDTGVGRVFEIDRRGKQLWSIDKLQSPGDAVVLPGRRVLIAEFAAGRVSERDFQGKILWEKKISQPIGVQRLANGNTFITTYHHSLVEVDRAGKEIYALHNVAGGVRAAYRTRQDRIFYVTPAGKCMQIDTRGNGIKSFTTGHPHQDVGGLDLLPNGHLLLSAQHGVKLEEYTVDGKKVLEVEAPGAATANGLPNGHFLVASYSSTRVYEVDRRGKIVWEHKNAGHVYRARRR
jgi:hypothetical protein